VKSKKGSQQKAHLGLKQVSGEGSEWDALHILLYLMENV